MKTNFRDEWPEDTDIEWWNAGRRRLNEVVRRFNSWQREAMVTGSFDALEARHILAHVEEGKQTWAATDGGGGWLAELETIEELVREFTVSE